MRLPIFTAFSLLLNLAASVWIDEAWSVDFHYPLLGQPRADATFFHQPQRESRASLLYALSEEGLLGAVNPRDGSVVWRQQLSRNASDSGSQFLRAGQDQDVVVSGHGPSVAAWNAADGRLLWDLELPGQLHDVEILELSDASETSGSKDAILLTGESSAAVHRVDGSLGSFKWTHNIDSADIPFQISASSARIFVISLHKTLLGYIKIKVTSLDPVTGQRLDEYTLSSDSELATAESIISVGANSASPIIAWTDAAHTVLKVNVLGSKAVSAFDIGKQNEKPIESIKLQAPRRANSLAHFLVHYQTIDSHWAEVYHIDLAKNKVDKAYELPRAAGKGAFSTSTNDANVYFTRITHGELTVVSSASHGTLGRWALDISDIGTPNDETIEPVHVESEVSIAADSGIVSALRTAVLLSTGDWVLLREGSLVWQRPEALANTVAATLVLPHEVEDFAHELEIEAESDLLRAYIHRWTRHLQDLQHLPLLLSSLPERILQGVFGTTAENSVSGNTFGFNQVIICATRNGRAIALNAGNPNSILWNRKIDPVRTDAKWEAEFFPGPSGTVVLTVDHSSSVKLNATDGARLPISPLDPPNDSSLDAVRYTLRDSGLEGFMIDSQNGPHTIWRFVPPSEDRVVSFFPRPVNDPVASIGKVLGDRRVLYKYLNPNIALVVTTTDAKQSATFYVLDTVSGVTYFAATHHDVDPNAPISSIVSENWFAYSYTSEATDDSTKGHFLVVAEMFESLVANDRGPRNANTTFSSLHSVDQPFVLTKSYQIPEAVHRLSVTRTQQGITSRQLLAVLADSRSIVGIPYAVLDPRRPADRDPTKDEQAEGLSRYNPVLEFDPKWYLNHKREVLGIANVITSPAIIESTSLVFAYGLDIFGTRLSPSFSFDILGKDFNKFQMLATVAALAGITFIVGPLVTRKQINTRWQFT